MIRQQLHLRQFSIYRYRSQVLNSNVFPTTANSSELRLIMKRLDRLFSGIQPSGRLHLGNYLGAIQNWVTLSQQYERPVFCLVDLHSLTSVNRTERLSTVRDRLESRITELGVALLACGLDPENCVIYQQSQVPYHAHLSWILNCRTRVASLGLMTQYKSKAENASYDNNCGLFTYPVLMAADILLFKAQVVPVGDDQRQHLELTRRLVNEFNSAAGKKVFPVPAEYQARVPRVMNLNDPTSKMSKSSSSERDCIFLTDTPDMMRKKIMKAQMDSQRGITYDAENRPAVANLVRIFSALSDQSVEEVTNRFASSSNVDFKNALGDLLVEHFKPIQARQAELNNNIGYIKEILGKGAVEANQMAHETMEEVHNILGLAPLLPISQSNKE